MGRQKGSTLTAEHKARIAAALKNVGKTKQHSRNISAAKKGTKINGWSDERKAERRRQIAEKKAATSAASNGVTK